MPLQFVKTEDGSAIKVSEKGLPLVMDPDKGENAEPFAIDALHLYTQVPALRSEAKNHREEKEKYQARLSKLVDVGLELPDDDSALEEFAKSVAGAVETVKNLKDGELIKAGEVDTIKRQAAEAKQKELDSQKKSYTEKIDSLAKEVESRDKTIYDLLVANNFNTSKFVREELAMNSKVALAYFNDCFKVETGEDGKRRVVGYYPDNGERVYSRERTGEFADFDEALSLIVEKDPARDELLRGSGASGGGASGAGGAGGESGTKDNPFAKETFNLTKQAQLMQANPDRAAMMARAAGVELYPK